MTGKYQRYKKAFKINLLLPHSNVGRQQEFFYRFRALIINNTTKEY